MKTLKTALLMIGVLAISFSLLGCTAGRIEGGCNADSDCEGEWVCRQGDCVDPCSGVQCGPGEVCVAGVCKECNPDCGGRECGPDPTCGTSCGTCSGGRVCEDWICTCLSHASQACHLDDVWWFDSCGGPEEIIADCQQGCDSGQCLGCTPDCAGRACGPDPQCGTSCGDCTPPETCDASGQCGCLPDCEGRECGPDPQCGVECGACSGGMVCASGVCQSTEALFVFVEAEQFADLGGWKLDSQFVDTMGSAYLLAHGMGVPVDDATTTVTFPQTGTYRLWVRTRDWVAPHAPGRFQVAVAGTILPVEFGTTGPDWAWQDGGTIDITAASAIIGLVDLTGFDGRCDALFFTSDLSYAPPEDPDDLAAWRRELLGLPDTPPAAGSYDLVVVGGGIAGTAAAIAAARLGLSVALIQDRPVLGGNASQEVRVNTHAYYSGKVVEELDTDHFCSTEGNATDVFVLYDVERHAAVEGEPNIDLFLLHRATGVTMNEGAIESVIAVDLRTGDELRFLAPFFVDSTGDGWIGFWAGADYRRGREGASEFGEVRAPANADGKTLGSTVMFISEDTQSPTTFPDVSAWTREVVGDFYAVRGDWHWEYGVERADLDTIYDAEHIRDHLLRAIYGAFFNAHQRNEFSTFRLTWVGYVAGKRESRRLVGDVLMREQDITNQTRFDDSVVTGVWLIDLHVPAPWRCGDPGCQSRCIGREFGKTCDWLGPCTSDSDCPSYDPQCDCDFRSTQHPQNTTYRNFEIPYRSLYSRNVPNLFMAGRNISTTHVAFGATRVMNTCGQMGVAVASAAALCHQYNTGPRGLYQNGYVPALIQSIRNWPAIILDNRDASGVAVTGAWESSTYFDERYGPDYLHDNDSGKGEKSVRFTPDLIPYYADYEVFTIWNHPQGRSRATNVPVVIQHAGDIDTRIVDQSVLGGRWVSLGTYPFVQGTGGHVEIRNEGTNGFVIADAVRFFPRDIIVDDAHPHGVTLTGDWSQSTQTAGFYGSGYLHDDNTSQGKSVTFTPALPFYTDYAVSLRWTAGAGRASDVPVDILHAHGTTTVQVDQTARGGEWVLLGAYSFRAGTDGRVVIRNDGTDGHVVADAVKLTPVIVMDNREANGVEVLPSGSTRQWKPSTFRTGQYWASDYLHDKNTGKGQKSVHFTPLVPFSGSYRVYLRWTDGDARAHNVPVDIFHAGGTTAVTVDQRTHGGKWNLLGTFDFDQGTAGGVHIRNAGTTSYVVVDAVMFERI